MGIRSFLASIFADMDERDGATRITLSDFRREEKKVLMDAYAIFTVVDFVASLMSNIELQTYYGNTQKESLEWYRLNIRPNKNQNAKEFWKEFWCKVLYYQEALIVPAGNDFIIADSFLHHPEYAVREDVFEGVSRGEFTFDRTFLSSEVFYMRYTSTDVMRALKSLMEMFSGLASHAYDIYTASGGEKGILNVNAAASGPEEFEKKYGEWINARFKSYFNASNAVMPLFKGMQYEGKKSNPEHESFEDIKKMMDSALNTAANAYKVPPAVLRGEVAGMADAFNVFLTTCVDPLASMLACELTAKEFTESDVEKGYRIKAFTNNIKHTDIFDVAASFDKLFADGWSHNSLNRLLGMPEINEPWANKHYITKNYADAQNPEEGGETQ